MFVPYMDWRLFHFLVTLFGATPKQQANFILIKGVVLTVIIMYGLTNGFTGVDIPEEYNVIIGK